MKVQVKVVAGRPHQDTLDLDPGRCTIGSEIDAGLDVLLTEDPAVQPRHAELLEEDGELMLQLLVPDSKASVNRKRIQQNTATKLKPGSEVRLGKSSILKFEFRLSGTSELSSKKAEPWWRSGKLADPRVRWGLAIYLLALVAVAVAFQLRGEATAQDQYAKARTSYQVWCRDQGMPDQEVERRLSQADPLVQSLFALKNIEDWDDAKAACRKLMAIDGEPNSPLFKFAARQLGSLNRRR